MKRTFNFFAAHLLTRIVAEPEIRRYMVDESQMISNAGDAVVHEYNGIIYEVITWNEMAMEHEPGTVTVSQLERED